MTTLVAALVLATLCLVVLPSALRTSTRLDVAPRLGLALWALWCLVGWCSAVVVFLDVGLGVPGGSLAVALGSFVAHLGDGHPLRGLGLAEVAGLSVAFDVTVLWLGGLVATARRIYVVRGEQRTVLDLVAETPPALEGVALLEHPYPMAYYLPGGGGRVVLSTGAVAALSESELDAVIAHEHGHRVGHHGSFFVPLQVLSSFVAFLPLARYAPSVMRTYLEMSADDYAREHGSVYALRRALEKARLFSRAPAGAFSIAEGSVERRVQRLDRAVAWGPRASVVIAATGSASTLVCLALLLHP